MFKLSCFITSNFIQISWKMCEKQVACFITTPNFIQISWKMCEEQVATGFAFLWPYNPPAPPPPPPHCQGHWKWNKTVHFNCAYKHGRYERIWLKLLGLAVRGGNTECTDTGCLGTVYRYGSKCTGIPEPTQGAELSLSLCLSLSHARTCMHVHTYTRAHTHIMHTLPPSPTPPPPPLGRIFFPPSTYMSPCLPTFPQSLSIAPANMSLAAQQGTL